MSEQVYVEAPITWVAYQWDGDVDEFNKWAADHQVATHSLNVSTTGTLAIGFRMGTIIREFIFSVGSWVLYSPQLNEIRKVNDDEFHRRYTAKW